MGMEIYQRNILWGLQQATYLKRLKNKLTKNREELYYFRLVEELFIISSVRKRGDIAYPTLWLSWY